MLYTCYSFVSVAKRLHDSLAGQVYSETKFVVLTYNKVLDCLRLRFYTDVPPLSPFGIESIVLATYYAPGGDWDKWYGGDWSWNLSAKRIALDVMTYTLTHNKYYVVNSKDCLPSWLRSDIESYL